MTDARGSLTGTLTANGTLRIAGSAEIVIAIDRGITLQQLAGVVHPYPTYAIGLQFLATDMAMQQIFNNTKGRILRTLSRLYR